MIEDLKNIPVSSRRLTSPSASTSFVIVLQAERDEQDTTSSYIHIQKAL